MSKFSAGGAPTATIVMVHGSWHGAWCWEPVRPLLAQAGHDVLTPNLPGHGPDRTPPERISLKSYTDGIGALLASLTEPAVLVGHSFGGVVVSQTAEVHPESVAGSVYVCGFLLRNGQSVWRHGFPSPRGSRANPPVLSGAHLIIDEQVAAVDLDRSVIEDGFYFDCPAEYRRKALAGWTPEPLAPLRTALTLTQANFGRVPRAYIACLADRVIPAAAQQRMCRLTPCRPVIEMSCGHFPMLARPAELAGHLHRLVKSFEDLGSTGRRSRRTDGHHARGRVDRRGMA